MNKAIMASAALLFLFPMANANAAVLKGAAADAFIQKYLPNAVIPGQIGRAHV